MSGWVLDSSFALAWVIPDEPSEQVADFLGAPRALWVPSIWWYEIANGLLTAKRRGRLDEANIFQALEFYRGLPLETDAATGHEPLLRFLLLGGEHGLTAYDAAYLELAARRRLSLATLDKALIRAAKTAGIQTRS